MYVIFIIFFSLVCSSEISSESVSLSIIASADSYNENYDGDDPSVYLSMYKYCLNNDDIGCANSNLNNAMKFDPKNEEYKALSFFLKDYIEVLNRAQKTLNRELYEEAIRDYNNIIKDYPDGALPYYKRGEVYRTLKNYANAIEDFKKACELNPNKEIYKNAIFSIAQRIAKEADQDAKRQDYNSAIPKYLEAISYYPKFTQAYFNLAKSFYVLSDYDNSKKYLLKNIEIDPSQYQSLKMIADIYRKERNLEEAVVFYKKAIDIDPNYYKAYYSLATLLISTDIDKSKYYLNKVILINPNYEKAHETLGIINMQLESFDEAIENFLISVSLNGKNYKSYYILAEIFNLKKEYEVAKNYAKSALQIKGNLGAAFFHLGVAEKNIGNRPAAKDAFEKAKKDKDWRASADYELNLMKNEK